MEAEKAYLFDHWLNVLNNSLALCFMHIFMTVNMYIAPRQGQTTYWGQSFDVNRKALSLWSFVTSFKKKIFNL